MNRRAIEPWITARPLKSGFDPRIECNATARRRLERTGIRGSEGTIGQTLRTTT